MPNPNIFTIHSWVWIYFCPLAFIFLLLPWFHTKCFEWTLWISITLKYLYLYNALSRYVLNDIFSLYRLKRINYFQSSKGNIFQLQIQSKFCIYSQVQISIHQICINSFKQVHSSILQRFINSIITELLDAINFHIIHMWTILIQTLYFDHNRLKLIIWGRQEKSSIIFNMLRCPFDHTANTLLFVY